MKTKIGVCQGCGPKNPTRQLLRLTGNLVAVKYGDAALVMLDHETIPAAEKRAILPQYLCTACRDWMHSGGPPRA